MEPVSLGTMTDAMNRILVLSDAMAAIKNGHVGKKIAIMLEPDFTNYAKTKDQLRYDVVVADTVTSQHRKRLNSRPLTKSEADALYLLMTDTTKLVSDLSSSLSGAGVSPELNGETVSPAMVDTSSLPLPTKSELYPEWDKAWGKEPEKGECFVVYLSTGCTCCQSDNRYMGPFETLPQAKECAKYHHNARTLRSQYAENGHQTIYKVDYERAGRWIIIDEWYAVKEFMDDSRVYGEDMERFSCYGNIVKD